MKSTNKTQPTDQPVAAFLDAIPGQQQQADSRELVHIMQEATGWPPVMWGSSMVGFGTLHYKYPTGREGDTMVVGFSPRSKALTLYGLINYDQGRQLAAKLGPHEAGKGCLYIKRLSDIDLDVLRRMIAAAARQ